ncbi:hypothetical protein AB1Y20_006279 [Prymnesium parvum]|uniref:H/ACA ribonucleoprotein complex subunit n=1 Tax=Prymnesium parvum TaxID=97485 RepID=A0AB34J3J2_PRYPA
MGFGGRGGGKGDGKGFGGRGKGKGSFVEGPPDSVTEMGTFIHACEGDMVIKSSNDKIPYFNAPIYLENKSDVGKVPTIPCTYMATATNSELALHTIAIIRSQVDEIFGTIQEVYFSVKPASGVNATSFKPGDKLYINPEKLLPLQRFLPGAAGGCGGGGKGKGGKGGKGKGGKGGKGFGKAKGKGEMQYGGKGKGSPGGRGKGKG